MKTNLLPVTLLAAGLALAQNSAVWRTSSGAWNDAARWSAGIPDPLTGADVRGDSRVAVPDGTWLAGDLRIGTHAGDRSRVEVNGGSVVLVNDSLFVGEDGGGQGELVLNSGALHSVMDVFVGGATASTGRANDSVLRIRGGTFLGRNLGGIRLWFACRRGGGRVACGGHSSAGLRLSTGNRRPRRQGWSYDPLLHAR